MKHRDDVDKINDFLASKGWSGVDLAHASGLSQTTVWRIINRKTDPQAKTLYKLLKACGLLNVEEAAPTPVPAPASMSEADRYLASLPEIEREIWLTKLKLASLEAQQQQGQQSSFQLTDTGHKKVA